MSFNSTDPGPADERCDLQAAELLAPRQQQQVPQHPAQAEPPHHQPLHHQPGASDQPSLSDERWARTENILHKEKYFTEKYEVLYVVITTSWI